jgi:hypothetical protein
MENINIEWLKCRHGIEIRNYCVQCAKEKEEFHNAIFKQINTTETRIAITRGCPNRGNPCFCSGVCHEIIGYRDPLYPGETHSSSL